MSTDNSAAPTGSELDNLIMDNPFWQCSLTLWQNKSLQSQLLRLQNTQDYRVNLLLLAIWLGLEGKDLRAHLHKLSEQVNTWHESIVAPIRQVRQALPKSLPDAVASLKAQLQACELQAEQVEQALLFQYTQELPSIEDPKFDELDCLIVNLSASELGESDLLLILQHCLPNYSVQQIKQRIQSHR